LTQYPSEAIFLSGTSGSNAMNFPLWLNDESSFEKRRTNLSPRLVSVLARKIGREAEPQELLDYIYGALHSPSYRSKYRQALSIAFPHIPYPPSPEVFRHISEKGEQLRRLHLMELAAIGDTPYPYAGEGDDVVASGYPKWDKGHVYINKDQYFTDVPKIAWEFYIGGYQPAQKWLKDRRARALSFDDITHYQRVVKILAETDRIMKEIELPLQ
jgi:predicted helicase